MLRLNRVLEGKAYDGIDLPVTGSLIVISALEAHETRLEHIVFSPIGDNDPLVFVCFGRFFTWNDERKRQQVFSNCDGNC